jgi:hypothetical protein
MQAIKFALERAKGAKPEPTSKAEKRFIEVCLSLTKKNVPTQPIKLEGWNVTSLELDFGRKLDTCGQ